MKHDQLCAIGHNIADSLASGLALVIGFHPVNVFGEAASSENGLIEIDFLRGQIVQGRASSNLRSAALRFAEVLPTFCQANQANIADFKGLSGTFYARRSGAWVVLSVTDKAGRSSSTEYAGVPLKRIRFLDHLGRIRRAPRKHGLKGIE